MTTVTVGDRDLELGGEHLVEMRDSSALLGDPTALRDRLQEDGYLLLRGFHEPDRVRAARRQVLEHMAGEGMLDPDAPIEEGVVHPDYFDATFDMDAASWTHYPALEELVSADDVMAFFGDLVDAKPIVLDRRLGRAKATGDFTGFHVDRVFMGRGTERLYTCWRPVGDCPVEMGPLVVAPGSHRHERLRETYGRMDVDAEPFEPYFSTDPLDVVETLGGPLATADFEAGDALVFGQYLLHGSLTNTTDRFRVSIDTRYQSIAEPVDARWMGEDPVGHYNWPADDQTPMAELRAQWGL